MEDVVCTQCALLFGWTREETFACDYEGLMNMLLISKVMFGIESKDEKEYGMGRGKLDRFISNEGYR